MKYARVLDRLRDLFPFAGFHFDRPLVLFQSDDWGRVGLRDKDGFDQLTAAGLPLGERPWDLHSLETADDLIALKATLLRHCDSAGRSPCMQMNFVVANLDFARMSAGAPGKIELLPLAQGLPEGWSRPDLLAAYQSGIADKVFSPALHGTTHFCRWAVERSYASGGERQHLLNIFWKAGTPYIHWRMPWIGYEYWDEESTEDDKFLSALRQEELIGEAVGMFAKLFSRLPHSACAPAYRANTHTHHAWAQHGVRVAQNGPGTIYPPHFDRHRLLHICRTVEFEPAIDATFSVDKCLEQAAAAFRLGLPAVVSIHSINFHSTVRDFRSRTLRDLDEFLARLEHSYSDLVYLHDDELFDLVDKGCYTNHWGEAVTVKVLRRTFTKSGFRAKKEINGRA